MTRTRGQGHHSAVLEDGCGVSATCFDCPLPDCQPNGGPRGNRAATVALHIQMARLKRTGLSNSAIGKLVGKDKNTVQVHMSGRCKCEAAE